MATCPISLEVLLGHFAKDDVRPGVDPILARLDENAATFEQVGSKVLSCTRGYISYNVLQFSVSEGHICLTVSSDSTKRLIVRHHFSYCQKRVRCGMFLLLSLIGIL